MTIYNNDILTIAKFMGIIPIKGINEHTGDEYYYYNNSEMQDFEALPLYNTWDELMPVLCKIEESEHCKCYVEICENVVSYGYEQFGEIDKFTAIFKFVIYWLNEYFKEN